MAWEVCKTTALFTETAYSLYNQTRVAQFPQAQGRYGIDENVAETLVALTRTQYQAITTVPLSAGDDMKGACIWASVIAAKFLRHRSTFCWSHVVHVNPATDHYFVVARQSAGGEPIIADITCRQFKGAPKLIIGKLREIKSAARGAKVSGGPSLYEAYELGASTSEFLL